MAEYRVVLARSADRDLSSLPHSIQARVIKAIDTLEKTPRPSGIKKLRGTAGLWRIRVGDYRVICQIEDSSHLVDVTHIRHRREAYE